MTAFIVFATLSRICSGSYLIALEAFMNKTILATCNLNQWALDFEGNLQRIQESIKQAKAAGAKYRLGPELEIPGYGCEDAFLEGDTLQHSWEVLAEILKSDLTHNIVCDIGMPIMHKDIRYNCRVFVLDGKILLVRPKMVLAMDGNYRERRWFTPWRQKRQLETLTLPHLIHQITGQKTAPIGDGVLGFNDTVLAAETCEELFAPDSPNIYLGLDGVEIIANGSGSHHELRKLHQRIDLIQTATSKNGGVYLYANQQGCDGGRLYFDGCALIAVNGKILAQGSQFSPKDVEVITATVDLEQVRSFRGAFLSRMEQASESAAVPRVWVDFDLTLDDPAVPPTKAIEVSHHTPEEEIAYGPAAWLWDYLRRSGMNGFFLPLSGGADSSAVATIVGSMCQMIVNEAKAGNKQVIADSARIVGDADYVPTDAQAFANLILHTCYMGTENSSKETRHRAKVLAEQIGARHLSIKIDWVITALVDLFVAVTEKRPNFKMNGGSHVENLALQNIQARSRMVIAYF
ncbi:MAG: NAD+ synthase (glutamine-hydrolyzing), partial [Cellvibrionaceae bacterium]